MSNPVVDYFKTLIGQPFTKSPSPVSNWLRPTLLEVEEGHLKASYVIREEFTNPLATLHGGISALIIDDIIGAAVYSLNSSSIHNTTNLNVSFLSPAKVGDIVIAEAKVIRKGKRMVNASCTISKENGKLVATSSSNLMVIS